MEQEILDVDLLAFERGGTAARRAVVDGVVRSLATGFVFTATDLREDDLDEAYDALRRFFALPADDKARYVAPGSHGQTGYTGLLVETAATAELADWKEMLNWGRELPAGHPLRTRYPHRYADQVFPERAVPGITGLLLRLHDSIADVQRRFLRVIAVGLGAHEDWFEAMVRDGAHLTRAVRYPPMPEAPGGEHVWAAAHGDINLITALPRATAPGLQVRTADGWVDAIAPERHVIVNTGMMLEHISNGRLPAGVHRVVAQPGWAEERCSVVQFCHPAPWTVLAPLSSCVDAERPERYSPITAGDRLDQVLWEIGLLDGSQPAPR